jgi:aspartyl-tRNA(Asn)/glutamyl-tRNA(Gln) amidotransferase subunit C
MSVHDPERLARELAGLARLELREHEAAQFGDQLAAILGYIDKLREVDVEGVPEYATAEQETSGLAADERELGEGVEQALAGVPARRGRLIAVPKFKDD